MSNMGEIPMSNDKNSKKQRFEKLDTIYFEKNDRVAFVKKNSEETDTLRIRWLDNGELERMTNENARKRGKLIKWHTMINTRRNAQFAMQR